MTEEEVKGLLKEASEKIKDDFIPSMTNLLMDVFQHGLNKGTEIGVKIGADKRPFSIEWQTGEPKEEGEYLVTLLDGRIAVDRWLMPWPCNTEEDDISVWEMYDEEVVAWCILSNIKPYKEETK